MFEIDGDLILFKGNPVARFEKSAWPTLRDDVAEALAGCWPDAPSETQHKIIVEEMRQYEAELRDARSDIRAYVREIAALEEQLDRALTK